MVLLVAAFCVYGATKERDTAGIISYGTFALLVLLAGVWIFLLCHPAFTRVEISDDGISVLGPIGGWHLTWKEIDKMYYWTVVESAYGVHSEEPFLAVKPRDDKIKRPFSSGYERWKDMMGVILEYAGQHHIPVERSRPSWRY